MHLIFLIDELLDTTRSSSNLLQKSCRRGEFQCQRSGECISVSFLCDFITQCEDNSDEELCGMNDGLVLFCLREAPWPSG